MTRLRQFASARGFSLVEVMVTLFIIAVGALGVAGLQLAAMRSNHSANLRSHATLAAYALADRMRAHPADFSGMASAITTADATIDNAGFQEWADELAASPLPAPASGALGSLDCTSGNPCTTGHCAITIRWDDSRAEEADLAQKGRDADALEFQICARVPQ